MLINFENMPSVSVPHLNGGQGSVAAKMSVQKNGKMMVSVLPPGASIGLHRHETSDDINYVLSGMGEAVCDGEKEILRPGVCHFCPLGSEHSICNTGQEDLVLFTAVPELK